MQVYTWIGNGLATMLATNDFVAPEAKLRNPLHAGNEAGKWRIHLGFETQGRYHRKSKTGVLMAPQKGLISSIFLKKK